MIAWPWTNGFSPLKTNPLNANIPTTKQGLTLRAIQASDLGSVHALLVIPETDRYNTQGIPASLTETQQILSDWISMAATAPVAQAVFCLEHDGVFTGICGLKFGKPTQRNAEIWYKLMPEHWNKGFATAAVKGMIQYCFGSLGMHRVEARCAVDNTASYRVMEKAGMQREGLARQALNLRGVWHDVYLYAILEDDEPVV